MHDIMTRWLIGRLHEHGMLPMALHHCGISSEENEKLNADPNLIPDELCPQLTTAAQQLIEWVMVNDRRWTQYQIGLLTAGEVWELVRA